MTSSNVSPFNPNCLSGKVAVITGGGSGIGYEIAKQLLEHGCRGIVILGRRVKVLEEACSSLGPTKCNYYQCDVRNYKDCEASIQYTIHKFGTVNMLVNSAAGNFLSEAGTLSSKGFKTVMEIDTLGTFNMCRAAYPYLKQGVESDELKRSGIIVNVSMTLHYGASWYQAHASAAKSAVDSLTRSLALEWGEDKIRVCGIAPGATKNTPGTEKLALGMEEIMTETIPLKKLGEARDIGLGVVFLCCDAAEYVTGTVLVMDGGSWLYRPAVVEKDVVEMLSRKVEGKSRALLPSKL